MHFASSSNKKMEEILYQYHNAQKNHVLHVVSSLNTNVENSMTSLLNN